MEKYHIALTDDEQALLAKIDLRDIHPNHDEGHAAHNANKEPILALLKSLRERKAIPQERRNYWTKLEYQNSRMKGSHRELFKRNGNRGADIYTSPYFLPFLRYFLFGADLPDPVIAAFEEKVGNPKWVTSSDVIPIGKYARDLTRQYHLDRHDAPEEFFKLCLDMGLGLNRAQSVMQFAKKAR